MKNYITPIILIAIATFLFFGFIDPTYSDVKVIKDDISQFNEALERSKELQIIRDELLSKYNTFSSSDIDRLEKLLPDNVDNVRLILDIDGIAQKYGLSISDISVSDGSGTTDEKTIVGPDGNTYGSVRLGFSIASNYKGFTDFLKDLERSLRLVDISEVSFNTKGGVVDFNEYKVIVNTYWLK